MTIFIFFYLLFCKIAHNNLINVLKLPDAIVRQIVEAYCGCLVLLF